MSQPRPRIVLTMIVKNEAHVIERCLRSIRPVIDAYCIVDTGSSDGTQDVIRRTLKDLPGEVHDIPWKDFAYNRTKALELARPWGEYSLMIDADEECHVIPGADLDAFRRSLKADTYQVMLRNAIHYARPQLTSTRLPFVYRGVLHEFLEAPAGAVAGGQVEAFFFRSNSDGARSKNPDKYRHDAKVFEEALSRGDEPDLESRYTFYYAQSLRDCGEAAQAAEVYAKRASLGGWEEEVYVSWLWCGRLRHELGRPLAEVFDALMLASDAVPQRAEAYCQAATYARLANRMVSAHLFAQRAAELPAPSTALFLEPDVYLWRSRYELSIAVYYVKDFKRGYVESTTLLAEGNLPAPERAAVERNLKYYV